VAARQDRVVRLESALIDAGYLQRPPAALRKFLKTKLKSALKTLVNDCLRAFDSGFYPCSAAPQAQTGLKAGVDE
jgi:hypothetical protein